MLHGDLRELLENLPRRRRVDVIVEDDLRDFPEQGVLVEVVEHGIELIGVAVFAVDDDRRAAASLQELIDARLGGAARVGDLAEVGEIVLVHLVEERDEFLVVVEDVPLLLLRRPVDVDLIGVVRPVGAVLLGGALQPRLLRAVRHEKQLADILPLQPQRQKVAAVVDAVGDVQIDVDDVLRELIVGAEQLDAVLRQAAQTLLRNIFGQCMQIFEIV